MEGANQATCPWEGFEPAAIEFCEKRLCHWVVEPANTWSNIGFIISGVCILLSARSLRRSELNLIGVVSILVGIGSALFHGTGLRWGEVIDVSAMYLISALFLTFALKRLLNLNIAMLVWIYIAVAGVSITTLLMTKTNGILLFAAQITVCTLLEIYMMRGRLRAHDYTHLTRLAVGFAVSFLLWFLDVRKIVCDPDNHVLGGHALWHLLNAYCLWCYYRFQSQFKTDATAANLRPTS